MGNNTIIMIGRGDQNGGEVGIVFNIVQGRDLGEGVKLVLVVGAAKVRRPRVANRVAMEAEHVHDADGGDAGTIEIGTLIQTGAD